MFSERKREGEEETRTRERENRETYSGRNTRAFPELLALLCPWGFYSNWQISTSLKKLHAFIIYFAAFLKYEVHNHCILETISIFSLYKYKWI